MEKWDINIFNKVIGSAHKMAIVINYYKLLTGPSYVWLSYIKVLRKICYALQICVDSTAIAILKYENHSYKNVPAFFFSSGDFIKTASKSGMHLQMPFRSIAQWHLQLTASSAAHDICKETFNETLTVLHFKLDA